MLVERSMDPRWLSNAYLVADEPGGTAVFVDSGGPLEPLHRAVEREGLNVTHLLTTHAHGDHHLAFVVNELVCFTGDIVFKDAVGGGPDAETIRRSVMDVVMTLPPEVRLLPGHTEETTVAREWEENPFVRYWRGEVKSVDEPVRVGGDDATLVVWSPDYDGKGKAMVRFGDGREAIVGGSRVER